MGDSSIAAPRTDGGSLRAPEFAQGEPGYSHSYRHLRSYIHTAFRQPCTCHSTDVWHCISMGLMNFSSKVGSTCVCAFFFRLGILVSNPSCTIRWLATDRHGKHAAPFGSTSLILALADGESEGYPQVTIRLDVVHGPQMGDIPSHFLALLVG